jgi:hypothetical protein
MKQHLKTIEEFLDLFGEEAFYSITLRDHNITLQARFNPSLIKRLRQDDYTYEIDADGYVRLIKNGLEIILTN